MRKQVKSGTTGNAAIETLESRLLLSAALEPAKAPMAAVKIKAVAVTPAPVKKPAPKVAAPAPKIAPPAPKVAAPAPKVAPPPPVIVQPILSYYGGLHASAQPDTAGSTTPAGLTPAQMRAAYGIGSLSFNGISGDGAGQTIAIVDAYDDPTAFTDINGFSSYYDLPPLSAPGNGTPFFEQLNENGASLAVHNPGTDPEGPLDVTGNTGDWETEESLDIEWAHAIAPDANIILFEANSDSLIDLLITAQSAAKTAGVDVVSMSWGQVEAFLTANDVKSYDSTYLVTPNGHSNVTFAAATGDSSSLEYPSTSPNVAAVGGTSLTVGGNGYMYDGETAWGNEYGDTGGGISKDELQPTYQANAGITLGLVGGKEYRTVPDVSMDADPLSGVTIYDSWDFGASTPWSPYFNGGTSLATPMWAGLIAIADQARSLDGVAPLSSAQTLASLYTLYQSSSYGSDFNDVTSGSNGMYSAGTGYDLTTGIGTPIVNNLIPALAGFAESSINTAYFKLDADGVHLDEWINSSTPGAGAATQQFPIADVGGINFNGAAGNDSLTLNFANGNFASAYDSSFEPTYNTGITFNAPSGGSNLLELIGTSGNDAFTAATTVINVPADYENSMENTPAVTATTNTVTPSGGVGFTPITLNNVQTIQFPGGSGGSDALNINGAPRGGYTIDADTASGTPNVAMSVGGNSLAVNFAATQHLASLSIAGAGDVVTLLTGSSVYSNALVVSSLSIAGTLAAPTALLDLTNGALIINDSTSGHATTVANVNIWIDDAADYNAATAKPRWDGEGITSSTVEYGGLGFGVDLSHSLGAADNGTLGASAHTLFAGQAVNQYSILIGYALTGDSNMDGTVNLLDYQNFQNGDNQPGTWQSGDFNHSGTVDALDFQPLQNNYGQTMTL